MGSLPAGPGKFPETLWFQGLTRYMLRRNIESVKKP
jgi:hypothetical protein